MPCFQDALLFSCPKRYMHGCPRCLLHGCPRCLCYMHGCPRCLSGIELSGEMITRLGGCETGRHSQSSFGASRICQAAKVPLDRGLTALVLDQAFMTTTPRGQRLVVFDKSTSPRARLESLAVAVPCVQTGRRQARLSVLQRYFPTAVEHSAPNGRDEESGGRSTHQDRLLHATSPLSCCAKNRMAPRVATSAGGRPYFTIVRPCDVEGTNYLDRTRGIVHPGSMSFRSWQILRSATHGRVVSDYRPTIFPFVAL